MHKVTLTRLLIVICFMFVGALQAAFSFEISAAFNMGNLQFADNRTATTTTFPILYPWGVSVTGTQKLSEAVSVDTGFYMDPTLKNIAYAFLTFNQQYISLGVGPFFGLFNTTTSLLRPGISTSIRIDLPGLLFVAFRTDSTIGGRLVQKGDYLQERSDISAGFYVPNAICSVNLITKTYTERQSTQDVVDGFTEYSFKTDLYQKAVPFQVLLSFAFQQRTKDFIDIATGSSVLHTLNSLVLGTEIDFSITNFLKLTTSLETSIYSFGKVGSVLLDISNNKDFLFNASAGLTLNLDALATPSVP